MSYGINLWPMSFQFELVQKLQFEKLFSSIFSVSFAATLRLLWIHYPLCARLKTWPVFCLRKMNIFEIYLFFSMSLYDDNHHNYKIFKETKQTNAIVYVLGRELNLGITRLLFCRKFRFIWNEHFLTHAEGRHFSGPMHLNFES